VKQRLVVTSLEFVRADKKPIRVFLDSIGDLARSVSDDVGNGKWQIMPGFGVRYSILEWGTDSYFVPAVRYAMSFAGDPSARRISEPQIAPTLNIDLPGRWFLTLYPSYDIRSILALRKLDKPDGFFSHLIPWPA
jgi:hypothetical protein